MASCLDVAGFLPAPCKTAAADLLESAAFAYAVGTAVAVCEAQRLHVVAMLLGGHRANVTAVKWCPAYHSRKLKEPGQLRLASGDADGGVVVWDVSTASPAARLEDVPTAAEVMRDYRSRNSSDGGPGGSGSLFPQPTSTGTAGGNAAAAAAAAAVGVAPGSGVSSLAWVMPGSCVLAVVVAPALLLLWDVSSGALLTKRELGSGSELFSQLSVDPLDSRRVCLCGSAGAVAVLELTDPGADKVALQQYRVNLQPAPDSQGPKSPSSSAASSSSSGRLQALFTTSRGLLVLLLPRELLLFDTALGAPAASTVLPANMSPFSSLLGVYGSGVCQGGGDDGGVDFLYTLHTDGGLSVWVRVPGELRYKLGCVAPLLHPPLRATGTQVSLCAVKAALVLQQQGLAGPHSAAAAALTGSAAQTAASTARITAQLSSSLGSSLGAGGSRQTGAGKQHREGPSSGTSSQLPSSTSSSSSSATTLSGRCLLVCAVTSDSRVWQWEVQLPAYPRRCYLADVSHQPITAINSSIQAAKASAVPAAVLPQLIGVLHTLPGGLTTIALQPCPLLLPGHTPRNRSSSSSHEARQHTAAVATADLLGLSDTPGSTSDVTSGGPAGRQTPPPAAAAASASSSSPAAAAAAAAAACVLVGAGVSSTGHLAVFTVRRGLINPLGPELLTALSVHRDAAKGLRWLGPLPLLVSFSSERSSSGAWKNTLLVTHVHTGQSIPFRDSTGSESCPLVGIRVSPSGSYILLLFKGAPAELWTPLPPPPTAPQPTHTTAATAAAVPGQPPPSPPAAAASGGSVRPPSPSLAGGSSRLRQLEVQGGAAAAANATGRVGGAEGSMGGAADASSSAGVAGGGGGVGSGLVKPWRVRLVDLPFNAVEWVVTEEDMHKDEVFCWGDSEASPSAPEAAEGAAPAAAAPPGLSPSQDVGGSDGGSSTEPWRVTRHSSGSGWARQPSYLAAPSMTAPAAAASAGVDGANPFPLELLAFSLTDGRSGVLSFRGRKVHDVNPKRPQSGVGPHSLSRVSAVCGVWPLMVLGDADGSLMAWDLTTGRCSSMSTGLGLVRRIQLSPASPPVLSGTTEAALSGAATARGSGVERMRAAVLFGSGQINVYDLDAVGRIRPGGVVSAAAASRLGVVKDIGWLPLPSPAGAGSILSVVSEDGSLALLDVSQPLAVRPSFQARQNLLKEVLSTHSTPATLNTPSSSAALTHTGMLGQQGVLQGLSPGAAAAEAAGALAAAAAAAATATTAAVQPGSVGGAAGVLSGGPAAAGGVCVPVVLLGPGPLGSSVLLKQPWVLLLRTLLQAGVSQDTLLYISSSSSEDDEEVAHELQQLLPRSAQAVLAHISAGNRDTLARLQQTATTATAGGAASSLQQLPGSITTTQQQQQQTGGSSSSTQVKQQGGSGDGSDSSSSRAVRRTKSGAEDPGEKLWGVPQQRFQGNLLVLLRQISQLRGSRQLLLPDEWSTYTEALQSGQLSRRMAVASHLSGHTDESRFWAALPATLAHIKTLQLAIQQRQQQQQQQLSRRTSAASMAASAAAAAAVVASSTVPDAGLGPSRAVAAGAAQDLQQSDATPAADLLGAGGAADDLDSLADASDYDFMVQQALQSSSQVSTPTAAHPSSTTATASAAGPAAASASSSTRAAAGGGGDAAAVSSPLARRGTGPVVPGRVLCSGSQQQFSDQGTIRRVAQGRPVRLWDEELVLSEAQEVLLWHEALPGQLLEGEGLLERRLMEYCCLGDFATAVAFLLSTPPESSVRYYRSVVCALALAATASLRAQGSSSSSSSTQAAATLHLQAAKVVSAHAASIGDNLLGVPLNCSAGLNADAVALLQEAGMWQEAAALTARSLTGTDRAQALSRWASHVRQHEGSTWRCVGLLTSAGCLQAAAQVLRAAELPDCAYAYVQACQEAGLLIPQQTQQQQQGQQVRWSSSSQAEDDGLFDQQQQQEQQPALELFDILGLRTRMLLQSSTSRAGLGGSTTAAGDASSGSELLQLIRSEYHQYLADLMGSL